MAGHSPELAYQDAQFTAFQKARGLSDSELQKACIALVEAAYKAQNKDGGDEVVAALGELPPRPFRNHALALFKDVGEAMKAKGESAATYKLGLEAFLKGDPGPIAGLVPEAHLERYSH